MEIWFLEEEKGWAHIWTRGRELGYEDALGRNATKPFRNESAAGRGLEAFVAQAKEQGYVEATSEEVDEWKSKQCAATSPELEELDRDWAYVGHRVRKGFAAVDISHDDPTLLPPEPQALLDDPRAQQIETLKIRTWVVDRLGLTDYHPWFDALMAAQLPALRDLELDSLRSANSARYNASGDLIELLSALPELDALSVMGTPTISGPLHSDRLARLKLDYGGTEDVLPRVLRSQLPCLEVLSLHPGTDCRGFSVAEVVAFFQREDLPELKELKLYSLSGGPELFEKLAPTPVLKTINRLTIMGEYDEAAMPPLIEHAEAFKHLGELVLGGQAITEEVEAALPDVIVKGGNSS